MTVKKHLRITWILNAGITLVAFGQNGATVTGELRVAGSPKEVSGAFVALSANPKAPPEITRPYYSSAISDRDGKFTFSNVPAGEYRLCFQSPTENLLNPCTWADKPVIVAVREGRAMGLGVLTMEEGARLEVDINDSQGLVSTNRRRNAEVFLGFSVKGPDRAYPLNQTVGRAQDTQYSIVVPYDTDLELLTQVSGYQIEDQDALSSVRTPNQLVRKLRFSRGRASPPVRIRVNGLGGAR
jgi:hypothetical protein